jgi:hypothetical protein
MAAIAWTPIDDPAATFTHSNYYFSLKTSEEATGCYNGLIFSI